MKQEKKTEQLEALETFVTKVGQNKTPLTKPSFRREFNSYAVKAREELIKSVERKAAQMIKNHETTNC